LAVRDRHPGVRVVDYVYDSAAAPDHVEAVLAAIADRPEEPRLLDVSGGASRREATLAVKAAVRVGGFPADLYGEDGTLDVSPGVLVTEAPTGRRSMHVGAAALSALDYDSPDQ
jgi:hypothetical protein